MLQGKLTGVALITGAGAGIGEEYGYAFAEAGTSGIVFADLNLEAASANAEKSKAYATNPEYRAVAVRVDASDADSVQAMVDLLLRSLAGLIIVLIVLGQLGATSLAPTSDIDIDNFDKTLAVNMRGTMLCIRAVTKVMSAQEPKTCKGRHGDERNLGRGCIVNLGSGTSYTAGPGMMAYVASKHAVMGITKVAALDNAKHQIRVNALCPTWVATPMLERSLGRWAGLQKVIERVSPAGRPALPEEVADVAVFICSPSSSYVNGTGLLIDAGMLVTANV